MASKYFVGSGNWSSATNWRTASNGATITTPPTASDTAFLDAYSVAVATDNTTNIAGLLNCTGCTGTLTFTAGQTLTVNSTLTFVSTMTITGTGKLKLGTTSATITSGGKAITGDFEVTGGTKTLSGTWSIAGLFSSSGSTTTMNSSSMTIYGGQTLAKQVTGTTTVTIAGGTLQSTADEGQWGLQTSFAGNITVGNWGMIGKTFSYITGTITVTAGTTCVLTGASSTNIIFNNFGTNFRFQNVKGLNNFYHQSGAAGLYIDGDFDFNGATLVSHVSGNTYIAGSIVNTGAGTGSLFSTNGTFILSGTGSVCSFNLYGNLTINTAGTITFPAANVLALMYSSAARTFTYTAGTVVVEAGHRLFCRATSRYINSGNIVWDSAYFGHDSVASVAYLSGNFKCNNLYVYPMIGLTANFPDNDPQDRAFTLTVRIYDGYTLTVYTSMTCFRGLSTYEIRANSGTAYIDYQGTLANYNVTNALWENGSGTSILESTKRILSYGGQGRRTRNIGVMNACDIRNGGITASNTRRMYV